MSKRLLIIIDVQKGFINEFTKEVPERIKDHLAENQYDFVVFTKFINKPDSKFVKRLNWKGCMKPEETEIVDELKEFINKENLFEKDTYSAFKSKELMMFIQANEVSQIFLCGLNTDACIIASAFDGFDLGLDIYIIKELTNTFWGPNEYNELVLKNMGHKIDPALLDNEK
tara:strand:- start:551 stop:1063 length:513 start_codon:yes stop_codon:yes gene_type:complete